MIFAVMVLGVRIPVNDGPVKTAIYAQRFSNAFISDGKLDTDIATTDAFTKVMGSGSINTKLFGIRITFVDPQTKKLLTDIAPIYYNQERFEQYAPASMDAGSTKSGFYERSTTYRIVYLTQEEQTVLLKMEMVYR
jgi:hypothetical protein